MDKETEKPNDLIVEFEDGQIDLFDEGPGKKPDVVIDDAPEKPRRKAKKADTEDATVSLKRQIDEANAALKAERDARAADAAKRAEMERELADARKRSDAAEGDSISNAKTAAMAELKQLKSDLAKAHNDGEYDKLGDIHEAIARAGAVLFHLDREEADYKERKETAPKEPEKKTETAPITKTPTNVDEWLASVELPPRAKEFFREHPEFAPVGKSKAKYFTLNAAHEEATAEGIRFDSDDYYNFLNKRLIDDEGDEEGEDDMADDADDKARAAAPVSRGSSTPRNGSTPQRVRLTRDQREAAEAMGLSPESYARWMLQAQKEGKIQP